MTVILTVYGGGDAANDGETHISELTSGSGTTQVFDAIEFGQGNNPLAVTDNRSAMTSKIAGVIVQKVTGYPVLGDDDVRNDGRATDRWTWMFTVPEGTAILASNWIVTNYSGGAPSASEPILVHSNDVVVKRADQVAHVFLNVTTAGAPSVVIHVEDGTPLTEQMQTWRQQSIAMSGAPGSTPVSNGSVLTRATEGEQVWIGARLLNAEGAVLTRDDVLSITLRGYKRVRERDWEEVYQAALDPYAYIPSSPVRTDARWRAQQGYNFSHAWVPPGGWGARRTRLEYKMHLAGGDSRTLVHEIEFLSTRGS